MLENIYICRHGYRANWEDETIDSGPTYFFHDPPLAKRGLEQADALGQYMASRSPKPDALFCSPFYRCLQTIEPMSKDTGLPVHIEPGLGEWFAPAPHDSGLHARPPGVEGLQPHVNMQLVQGYAPTYYPSRHGETIPELRVRLEKFLEVWIARVERDMPHVKTAVLMSHGGVVIGLGRALTGDETQDIVVPTASVSLFRREELPPLPGLQPVSHTHSDECWKGHGTGAELGHWVQLTNGETQFLPNGAERAWTYRDIKWVSQGLPGPDPGDGRPFTDADINPTGLAPGMDKYLIKQ